MSLGLHTRNMLDHCSASRDVRHLVIKRMTPAGYFWAIYAAILALAFWLCAMWLVQWVERALS